jgi:hypothetical protein
MLIAALPIRSEYQFRRRVDARETLFSALAARLQQPFSVRSVHLSLPTDTRCHEILGTGEDVHMMPLRCP